MQAWQPTYIEGFLAGLIACLDESVECDAICVFGNALLHEGIQRRLVKTAARFYQRGLAKKIVLDGMTRKEFEQNPQIITVDKKEPLYKN